MSSVRGSEGWPLTMISRYVACSFDVHLAVSSPGRLTNGVSTVLSLTHAGAPPPIAISRPAVRKYAWATALRSSKVVGFVHDPDIAGSVARPNNVFAGGGTVDRNAEKFTTQPTWPSFRHNGMVFNAPPASCPFATGNVAPRM